MHSDLQEVIGPSEPKNFATGLPGVFELPQDEFTVSKKWRPRRFSVERYSGCSLIFGGAEPAVCFLTGCRSDASTRKQSTLHDIFARGYVLIKNTTVTGKDKLE
uniref:Uncharacterized protein n=1 Tax=Echinococcus granulosus TaxID=6210 RepID=A0A068WXS5_ECHGR|nr:hypothetical protein EgrG_002031500 [Echinococcus granulosus]